MGLPHPSSLSVDDQLITTITDTYSYLGHQTGPLGAKPSKFDHLTHLTSNVTRAPLEPQQRLEIFKIKIIPQLIHQHVLALLLKNLEIQIRKAVNRWFCQPKVSPLEYFYAPVGGGRSGLAQAALLYTGAEE